MGKPRHMDREEWLEYQMTEEYRYELMHEDEEPYDDYDEGYADYLAEEEMERLDREEEEEEEEEGMYREGDDYPPEYEDFHADG